MVFGEQPLQQPEELSDPLIAPNDDPQSELPDYDEFQELSNFFAKHNVVVDAATLAAELAAELYALVKDEFQIQTPGVPIEGTTTKESLIISPDNDISKKVDDVATDKNLSQRVNDTPEGALLLSTPSDVLRDEIPKDVSTNNGGLELGVWVVRKSTKLWEKEVERKRCVHCQSDKTPQWREGAMGKGTLCNACGVQYRAGKLVSEYRPASSPVFDGLKHSNFHKRLRDKKKENS